MIIKCPYPNNPCYFLNKNGNCNHRNPHIEEVQIGVSKDTTTTVCYDYTNENFKCGICGGKVQKQTDLYCKKCWRAQYKWLKQNKPQ